MAPTFVTALCAGMLLQLSLIVAVGPQNSFILRQGVRREHVGMVVGIYTLSDTFLIACGVLGLGSLLSSSPAVMRYSQFATVLFLGHIALSGARRALSSSEALSVSAGGQSASRKSVAASAMAFTWLNPHVYIDTVLLLGSASVVYAMPQQLGFFVGASAASLLWFCCLGFGSAQLAPVLQRAAVWRAVEMIIAVTMVWAAWGLFSGHV